MFWTFENIIYIPFETDWVQNATIHWVCFVGVHTPLLFGLKQLQITLASSSGFWAKINSLALEGKNHTYCQDLKLIFCWQSYDILLIAIYFRYVILKRVSYLLHSGFRHDNICLHKYNKTFNKIYLTKILKSFKGMNKQVFSVLLASKIVHHLLIIYVSIY